MEVVLTVRVLKAADGEVTQVDCVPNINEIPDGTLRQTVMTMLRSLPGNWRETIDKRRPTLRLAEEFTAEARRHGGGGGSGAGVEGLTMGRVFTQIVAEVQLNDVHGPMVHLTIEERDVHPEREGDPPRASIGMMLSPSQVLDLSQELRRMARAMVYSPDCGLSRERVVVVEGAEVGLNVGRLSEQSRPTAPGKGGGDGSDRD